MNPPYRPYTQGKLDMVPRSSEDASRATRGQPKRPSYLSRNGGNVIVFLSSQPSFRSSGAFFVCARLAVYYLAVYSFSGSLIKQTFTATATRIEQTRQTLMPTGLQEPKKGGF